jgi:hypothetical protein
VKAIVDGREPKGLRLAEMLGNGPLAWEEQRSVWELCVVRLAQEVVALHPTPAGLLDDRHDLSPAFLPAVSLGIVLQPVVDELGGPLGEAVLCGVMSNLTMVGGRSVLNTRSTRQ